jgi:hypothetical protein
MIHGLPVKPDHMVLVCAAQLDAHTLSHGMWGKAGPSAATTTSEYAPPEALFSA